MTLIRTDDADRSAAARWTQARGSAQRQPQPYFADPLVINFHCHRKRLLTLGFWGVARSTHGKISDILSGASIFCCRDGLDILQPMGTATGWSERPRLPAIRGCTGGNRRLGVQSRHVDRSAAPQRFPLFCHPHALKQLPSVAKPAKIH